MKRESLRTRPSRALAPGARLYTIALSNPAEAVRAMLVHKRLPHRVVRLPAGFHPPLLRAAGFVRPTVPALELAGGRRVQGSLAIPRVLDELVEERPLYPREPVRVLLEFADLAPLAARRPCAAQARRLFPTWDGPIPSTAQLRDGSAGIVESSR